MDRFPPELLLPILDLACDDGGFTGRSLALTSRYIGAVASTCRFHSVAVRGPRIIALAAALDSSPPHAPPLVRHLYLSTLTEEERLQVRLGPHGYIAGAVSEVLAVKKALLRVLLVCAPALDTLALLTNLLAISHIPGRFPRLRALTIRAPRESVGPPLEPPFPALARLHLTADCGRSLERLLPFVRGPGLRHLRLSDVDLLGLQGELLVALAVSDGPGRTRALREIRAPMLRELQTLHVRTHKLPWRLMFSHLMEKESNPKAEEENVEVRFSMQQGRMIRIKHSTTGWMRCEAEPVLGP